MSRLRHLIRRDDGTAAIEFALIGLLLIVVSVGTIEVGRALFLFNELAHAADRAARLILIDPTITDGDLGTAVRDTDLLTGLSPAVLAVSTGSVTDDGISFRTVRLEYPFTPMVSGLTISSLTMATVRRVPI